MSDTGIPYPFTPEAQAEWNRAMADVMTAVHQCFDEAVMAHHRAREILTGRNVRITSDYNGQPFGSSRPSLKGEIRRVVDVHFEMYQGISLRLDGCRLFISIKEVELV